MKSKATVFFLCFFLSACSLAEMKRGVNAVPGSEIDMILSVLDPRLGKVEGAIENMKGGLARLEVKREEDGISPEKNLSWTEWGYILAALLGFNVIRDRKYVAMAKEAMSSKLRKDDVA